MITLNINYKRMYGWHYMERKGDHQSLWDKGKIIDRDEHWNRRCFKEAVHILDHVDLLCRPSIEMNTMWEPIIKKVNQNYFRNIKNN